jgi:hypothetical protein
MWKNSIVVGFFLAVIVFVAGYGRVLLVELLLRCLLVAVGTTLTIVGANEAITLLVESQGGDSSSTKQVEDVDFSETEQNEATSDDEDVGSEGGSSTQETDVVDTDTDLEDEAEIEELAEMVSDTMNEDNENLP